MQGESRKFGVSRWTALPSGRESKPDLQFVPPLLRRRLSRLSGLALAAAHDCLAATRGIPIVFASQHGELTRTADILADMARGEPISPTAFSLSVHNSATGLLALAHQDRAAATAIAAGRLTLAMGLLEAVLQAADSNDGLALLVYAEETAPALYEEQIRPAPREGALAMLIDAKGTGFTLRQQAGGVSAADPLAGMQALLSGHSAHATLGGDVDAWQLTRHARAA